MAVTWNKNYFEVGGTFSGTGDADFEVYINNLDTLVWRYKENGVWSSTSVHNITGASYANNSSTITCTTTTLVKGMPFTGASIPDGAKVGVISSATSFEMTDFDGVALVTTGAQSNQTLQVLPGHYTTGNWALNTDIKLGNTGVTIKLTRTSKSTYNTSDKWSWSEYGILQLNPNNDTDYDTLEVLERADKRDLVAISKTSGNVALIEDFESDTPSLIFPPLNIGSSPSIDTCNRNKELFIASGKEHSPRFLGYTKNNGFEGTSNDFKLVEDKAYEQIDSESFEAKAMNDFVFLRGNGDTQGEGTILVGIIYGIQRLYIWNNVDEKVYQFALGAPPLRIRLDPSKNQTINSNYVINGIAVMTEAQNTGYINSIECWSIPCNGTDDGQGANLDRVVDVAKPSINPNIEQFTDFLIVSSHFDREDSSVKFDLITSGTMSTTENIGTACLFKTEDFDEKSSIGATPINITPSLNYSNYSSTGDRFISKKKTTSFEWIGGDAGGDGYDDPFVASWRRDTDYSYAVVGGADAEIDLIQDICLDFAGYDNDGENPMIHFTARIKAHTYEEITGHIGGQMGTWDWVNTSSHINFSNRQVEHHFGPFWEDDTGKALMVSWITFSLSALSTGQTKCAKLLHLMDWNNISNFKNVYRGNSGFTETFMQTMVDNNSYPPNNTPNFSKDTTRGLKKHFVGVATDEGTAADGLRFGMISTRPYAVDSSYSRTYFFKVPRQAGGDHIWEGEGVWIYPNIYATLYTNISTGEMKDETQPTYYIQKLETTNSVDSKRWMIGDTDYGVDIVDVTTSLGGTTSHNIGVSVNNKMYAMSGPDDDGNVGRISTVNMNDTDNTIKNNILGTTDGWIELGTPTVDATSKWVGGTTKKIFYRVSLVYDGYQESTLLTVESPYSNATAFPNAFKMVIKLKPDWIPPDRVASIAVYRADDSDNLAISPDGLYRFIEEVPLVAFSTDTSGDYVYTVRDNGSTQGSYGAINGIAETLTNLYISYTVCASSNGYLFVGNCNHHKFDSAENYIFRSQAGKYSIFDWSKDFAQVDFIPKAMAGFMGKLYIFGDSKTAILNPETLIVEDEINGVGCIGPKALQNTPNGLYWFDQNNIYLANPQIKKIGTAILKQADFGWTKLTSAEKESAVSGYDSNRHNYLIYFTKGSDNRVWSYYIATGRWDFWATDYRVYDTVQASDGHSVLLMDNGRISKHLGGTNKRDWEWISKKISLGEGTVVKKIKSLKVDSTSRSATDIVYKTNDNNASWQSGSDISSKYFNTSTEGNAIKVASADSKVRWIQTKISSNNNQASSDFQAKSLGVVFKPKRPK